MKGYVISEDYVTFHVVSVRYFVTKVCFSASRGLTVFCEGVLCLAMSVFGCITNSCLCVACLLYAVATVV